MQSSRMESPRSVSRSIGFVLAGQAAPGPMRLSYTATAPWQVTVDFPPGVSCGDDGPARWVLGRELLLAGVQRCTGEGDVRVLPVGPRTVIELRAPMGSSWLSVSTVALLAFLDATEAVVPLGREAEQVDWDAIVADLRRG